MATLSGGQRKRVALAHTLFVQPDLLILDEPTNHLDAETVEWLEQRLLDFTGALILVTHDRYFLDRVTNRILELERGAVQSFSGQLPEVSREEAGTGRPSSSRGSDSQTDGASRTGMAAARAQGAHLEIEGAD